MSPAASILIEALAPSFLVLGALLVALPWLRPLLLTVAMLLIGDALGTFETIQMLTGGGPGGRVYGVAHNGGGFVRLQRAGEPYGKRNAQRLDRFFLARFGDRRRRLNADFNSRGHHHAGHGRQPAQGGSAERQDCRRPRVHLDRGQRAVEIRAHQQETAIQVGGDARYRLIDRDGGDHGFENFASGTTLSTADSNSSRGAPP
jgi:hypothetical protein